jgi:hypothetical protein
MDLKTQVKTYKELGEQIEELEEKRKALGVAIMQQMEEKVVQVSNYVVRHYSRLAIKLSLEEARLLDMVKMQEVVDKERVKSFYEAGHSIPGVSETHYIQVTEPKPHRNK